MTELRKYSNSIFENIKKVTEAGIEFWYARDLQVILEYAEWRNFSKVIDKAKIACQNSGSAVTDHFVDVNKMADQKTELLEHMEFEFLELLRKKNPAWRLLASLQAPFVAAFLYKEFIADSHSARCNTFTEKRVRSG